MVNIINKAVIGITIGSYELKSVFEFRGLIIQEYTGLNVPIFELKLRQNNYEIVKELKIGKSCVISFGKSIEEARQYKFMIINYSSEPPTKDGVTFTISGMLDVREFINDTKIDFGELNSYQILSGLSTITPKVNMISDDYQVWIRNNLTEKQYAEELLKHCWISNNTYPVYGLNIKKELIIWDYKKLFAQGPKVTFVNKSSQSKSEVAYDGIHFESDNAILNHFVSNRVQPVLSFQEWQLGFANSDTLATNNKDYYELNNKTYYPTKLDCGNVHPNYYNAEVRNLTKLTQLLNNNAYVTIGQNFLTEDDITLLDKTKIVINDDQYKGLDSLSGDYIVGGKEYYFSPTNVRVQLILNRDFNLG
jgi:hypothetical protein